MALRPFRSKPSPLIGVTKALLAAVVFLTPLFFIPGLNDSLEFPKAALLVVLTLSAACTWLLATVTSGEFRWRNVRGWWILVSFVAVVVLSTVFSMNRTTSLIGANGYAHHTLPVIASLVLFVFLAVQVLDHEEDLHRFVAVLLTSLGLGGLLGILQLSGVSPFGFPELRMKSFLPTGSSATTLGVLMGVMVPLGIAQLRSLTNRLWRIVIWCSLASAAVVLLAVDSFAAWICLLVAIVVMIAFVSVRQSTTAELGVSIAALVLAVVGMLISTGSLFKSDVPQDARLDSSTSWSIVKSAIADAPVIGSGPGTFYYDFVRYVPVGFSATPLGSLRFAKASDEGLQMLAMIGALGALLLIGLIGHAVYSIAVSSEDMIRRQRKNWPMISAVVASWCGVTASMFFAPTTVTTFAAFWFMFALISVVVARTSPVRATSKPPARIAAVAMVAVVVIVLAITATWSTRIILADRELVLVAKAVQQTKGIEEVTSMIDRAIRLNPTAPLPYLLRAQSDLVQAQLIVQQGGGTGKAQALAAKAIADAETAVSSDPNNPAVLDSVAEFYKSVSSIGGGSDELVIHAYEREVAVEPNNPFTRLSLAQGYYLIASSAASQTDPDAKLIDSYVAKARTAFAEVLRIVPGDITARYGLVLVDEFAGNKDEALAKLEQIANDHVESSPVWHQLGVRYLSRNDTAKAKSAFERAVAIDPSNAQAHWQLGLLAEEAKDYTTAKSEYETVKQIDPTNTDVQKKLDELPKG